MEPSDQNTLPHPSDSPAPEKSPAGRFVYASGARPLSGYTIKRGVGQGGFGEIYYATSDAGKDIALKLIRRNLEVELRGIRQCLNLKHPNLLDLYDIRQDQQGDTWVVMEYVADPSLEAVLADRPTGLPQQEALLWIHGIGAGVAYLHDRGIVHRDLKPGNIFRDEGVVKVGDYGLSKFISCSRRSGHTESIGTVHYMAPEVAHGRYGKELDIYALGAILYELLTGHVPFDGESVGEVLMKHLTAQPDVSQLAEPYRSVVARALEKDPARRFATVGEMLAALPAGASGPGFSRSSSEQPPTTSAWCPAGTTSADRPPAAIPRAIPVAQPAPAHQPVAADIVGDEYADREPIAQFVAQHLQRFRQDWQRSSLRPGTKGLIVAGCILLLLCTVKIWLPVGLFLLIAYGGYRVVRFFYRLCFRPTSMARPAAPVASAAVPRRGAPSEAAMAAFVIKPPAVRATELVGSLLAAAAVTAAMCIVMLLIETYRGMPLHIEQCAWLYLASLAGAWCVLTVAKFWEGSRGERMLRHFILMVAGFGLGLVAFGVADALLVQLPIDRGLTHGPGTRWVPEFYKDGRPNAMAYMAVFATLLAVLRWWLDADPMRNTRLSLRSLLVTVIFAHAIATVWQFPEPWLMMVAACMSVSVQLSSPWVPTYARLRPQRKKVV